MTSVPPYGIRVPMLLGGVHAAELASQLQVWGMDAKVVSRELGVASATKMCRSVMIKGLEALVIESYTTARRHGVEDAMLATLAETFPGVDWPKQGAYFFSRVAQHGKRRAEEMREAALTVREAGFEPFMSSAIAAKHDWVAQQAGEGAFAGLTKDAAWQAWADRLIAHLEGRPGVVISDERSHDLPLETGGGIKFAQGLLGEAPILVANIDSVWIEDAEPPARAITAGLPLVRYRASSTATTCTRRSPSVRIRHMPLAMAAVRMSASAVWAWICARMASLVTSSSNTPVRPW